MNIIEKLYSHILKYSFQIINPFKKAMIETQCEIHKLINIQAIEILYNDNYNKASEFFNQHISYINLGAYWADQDFKSSSHLYNPITKKGLFGRKNAMDLALCYYDRAVKLWLNGKGNESMFFLGSTLHIIQDMTIPQHANVKLLDNHRQYETFVKRTYQHINEFRVKKGTYKLDYVSEYIRFNTRVALKIYKRFKSIKEKEVRYYRTAACTLPLAQRTTAGCMLLFYNDFVIIEK